MLIALLVLCTFAFWGAIFLVFFQAEGKTPWDVFLGEVQPPTEELGVWRPSADRREDPDELFEERLLTEGSSTTGPLLRQRRIRSKESGEVLRVLPDERVSRRRRKKPL